MIGTAGRTTNLVSPTSTNRRTSARAAAQPVRHEHDAGRRRYAGVRRARATSDVGVGRAGRQDGDVGAVVVGLDLPARVGGRAFDQRRGRRGLVGGDEAAEPAVGEPADAPQPGRGAPAEPDVERPRRQRRHRHVVEVEDRPWWVTRSASSRRTTSERLVEERGAVPARSGEELPFRRGRGPDPERRQDPPRGERGQRRELRRDERRVAPGSTRTPAPTLSVRVREAANPIPTTGSIDGAEAWSASHSESTPLASSSSTSAVSSGPGRPARE